MRNRVIVILISILAYSAGVCAQEIKELNNGIPFLPAGIENTVFFENNDGTLFVCYINNDKTEMQISADGGDRFALFDFPDELNPEAITPLFFYKGQFSNLMFFYTVNYETHKDIQSIEIVNNSMDLSTMKMIDSIPMESSYTFLEQMWTFWGRKMTFYSTGDSLRYFVLNSEGFIERKGVISDNFMQLVDFSLGLSRHNELPRIYGYANCLYPDGASRLILFEEADEFSIQEYAGYSSDSGISVLSSRKAAGERDEFLWAEDEYLMFAFHDGTTSIWNTAQIQAIDGKTDWGFIDENRFGFWNKEEDFVCYAYSIDEKGLFSFENQGRLQFSLEPIITGYSGNSFSFIAGIDDDKFKKYVLNDLSLLHQIQDDVLMNVTNIPYANDSIAFLENSGIILDFVIDCKQGILIENRTSYPLRLYTDSPFDNINKFILQAIIGRSALTVKNGFFFTNLKLNHTLFSSIDTKAE